MFPTLVRRLDTSFSIRSWLDGRNTQTVSNHLHTRWAELVMFIWLIHRIVIAAGRTCCYRRAVPIHKIFL